jgi:hypothetical protein
MTFTCLAGSPALLGCVIKSLCRWQRELAPSIAQYSR